MALLFFVTSPYAATVVIVGDSLSAGYNLGKSESWVALLQKKVPAHTFVNASVSGATSGNFVKRLSHLLQNKPAVMFIAIGANDGLRGLPLAQLQKNLETLIDASQKNGTKTLLMQIHIPENYGAYAKQFAQVYEKVAKTKKVQLVPFFLQSLLAFPREEYFLSDDLHPNAKAQPLLADFVAPYIQKALTQ